MKRTLALLAFFPACLCPAQASDPTPASTLWYKQPAQNWEKQALPIGNGRIGAMVFGGDRTERLALNEISFWSGGITPDAVDHHKPTSDKSQFGCYQPFADFFMDFQGEGVTTDYVRTLSHDEAVATASCKKNGVTYKREVFASFPDQVIVVTCSADKPGALSAIFRLEGKHGGKVEAQSDTITLTGALANELEYSAQVTVVNKGGKLMTDGETLVMDSADKCTIYIDMATDYVMDFKKDWKGTPPQPKVRAQITRAREKGATQLRKRHVADYKSLFDRVKIDLGTTAAERAHLPTDERIEEYKKTKNDPDLEELMFQHGRYLLISSSRPGTLPANLQGLWNDNLIPPWSSDYHSNINLQMNYWLAETTNLSECHQPLLDFFEAMAPALRIVTQKAFKKTDGTPVRGWTVRNGQNPFGGLDGHRTPTGPGWNIPGPAWYALHMWEHYAFTQDKDFLARQGYPMMKEISQFWEDNLKELGADGTGFKTEDKKADMADLKGIATGTLVAPDAWSPEHGPKEDGVMHDQQLIWNLFNITIDSANILGADKEWAKELAAKREKLAGPRIGKEGNLQEWLIDRSPHTAHRHTSHLFAVYPGSQISYEKTPELAAAAEKALLFRGSSGDSRRSWTWPWRAGIWARLKKGDKAHEMVNGLLCHNMQPNLFTTHPPFQIDGSLGITGGMAEMLIQSHTGEIVLLPAPASAWPSGSVTGLRARGNVEVDFAWKDGKITTYTLHSPHSAPVKVRVNGELKIVTPQKSVQ